VYKKLLATKALWLIGRIQADLGIRLTNVPELS
jgi:hypothetical protein